MWYDDLMKRWKRPLRYIGVAISLYVVWAVIATVISANVPQPKAAVAAKKVTCSTDASALLSYINKERKLRGSPVLTVNSTLAAIANNKLVDMRDNKYYGHNRLDGSTPAYFYRQFGVQSAWSEDLDLNALSPAKDWAALKASKEHYDSLMNPLYTKVGIATECENYKIRHETGPTLYGNLAGTKALELTVIELTPSL
jgi:uncharacterized protein YkwD